MYAFMLPKIYPFDAGGAERDSCCHELVTLAECGKHGATMDRIGMNVQEADLRPDRLGESSDRVVGVAALAHVGDHDEAHGVTVVAMTDYGYTVEVPAGYDEAVIKSRLAFKAEGFSIISEMHVGGLLGPEAGEERQYLIMGVWNGNVGERAVGEDMRVAVHLPCNLVIQETGTSAMVAALDPAEDTEEADDHGRAVAGSARSALARALGRIGATDA